MSSVSAAAGAPVADGLTGRRHVLALAAILLSVAMATLDTAIANTALPTIAESLRVNEAQVIWVVNAYQLAVVAVLLPFAASGEILGHGRVFAAGTLLFTAASLVCGLAESLTTLVAARILQGIGGAAIMSVNIALIRFVFPAHRLGRGVGMNSMVVALAFTVGPTVASGILAVASWHWLFLINVPIGVVAVLFANRALPPTERQPHGFDRVAALLCAGLFGCAVLGFESLSHGSAWTPVTIEWVVAMTCGALLWRRQAGHPAPMLAVDLFRARSFALSAATSICAFATQGLGFVSLPFLLQNTFGMSQVQTGFLMTPWPLVIVFIAPLAGMLSDRYSAGMLGGIGLAIMTFGLLLLATTGAHPAPVDIAWRMAVCGLGFGLFQSPNNRQMLSSAPRHRSGGASGMLGTARLSGQTLGAALVALIFGIAPQHGTTITLVVAAGFAAAAAMVSLMRISRGKTPATA